MTNPKDPQAELLAKLKSILDQAEPYMKHGVEEDWQAFIATVQSILALFQAREQQLLTELLGELPEKYKHNHHHDIQTQGGKYKCLNCRKTPDEIAGNDSMGNCPHFRSYNKALSDVVSVIERLQNKTNDGGTNGGL